MKKFYSVCLAGAITALLAGPVAAEPWVIDFDNGVDQSGNGVTFASNTIFSDDRHGNNWQRYDSASNTGNSGSIAADGGIPNSSVNVSIDVWNGRGRRGKPGFAVGFDSSLSRTRDRDLEGGFNPQGSGVAASGYRNVLIIQSHENKYTKHCGGKPRNRTHKQVLNTGVCSDPGNDPEDRDFTDDEARGGDIVFEFDQAVTLLSMNVFDIEERGGKVKFADETGDWFAWQSIPTVGDNGVGIMNFGDGGIVANKMMVWLAGSGAIDNITGGVTTTANISEPGALAIFGVGLMAMGFYRRRRATGTAAQRCDPHT